MIRCHDTFGFPVDLDLGREGVIHCFTTKVDAPAAPAKDAQQIELEKEQIATLKEQRQMNKDVMPYVMENLGLTKDPASGEYRRMSEDEKNALLTTDQKADIELNRQYRQKALDALQGKLPISPALTKSLDEQEARDQAELRLRLGKDAELSTAGIKTADTQKTRRALVEEEARRGMMTTAQGLYDSNSNRSYNQTQGTNQYQTAGYMGAPGSYNNILSNYSSVIAPMQNERLTSWDYQNRAAMQSSANQSALNAGLMSMLGQGAGAAAYYFKTPAAMPSSKTFKKDITKAPGDKVLKMMGKAPAKSYRYKGTSGPKQIGPIAEDMPASTRVGPGGKALDVAKMVGMHHAAINALNAKVDKLARR